MDYKNKKIIIPILIGVLISVFYIKYSALSSQRERQTDYDLIIENNTTFDLENVDVETTQGEVLLSLDIEKGDKIVEKLSKANLISGTDYDIVCRYDDKIIRADLISFTEKDRYMQLVVEILYSDEDGMVLKLKNNVSKKYH